MPTGCTRLWLLKNKAQNAGNALLSALQGGAWKPTTTTGGDIMPRVKFNGKVYQIPYDPRRLADLIYKGYEVYTDEGVPPEQQQREYAEIDRHLKSLWGNQALKTTPKRLDQHPDTPRSAPDTGLLKPQAGMSVPPGFDRDINYRAVDINPSVDFRTPQVEFEFQNNMPARTEAKRSIWDDLLPRFFRKWA